MEYRTFSNLFGLGQSAVAVIVGETWYAITSNLLKKYVYMSNGDRLKRIVEGFEACWEFLQARGAIDGSHFLIIQSQEHTFDYYNH